ncbi:asparagine synthase-related protein [Aurantiacibacter sp. MUD11]|uniref:asparagine synthetase B family protein n=1 Tax=Aurantiacibacter sp. MUD11 TaxID=3003265 RepID=UPI0022AA2D42|nr:asparagine synthase-related protein [Aurantiacibacter sp. MUD11]WAT17023.1 asparagine synthase-related protein [Aurantiacibacter sp. MUD11]
MSAVAAVLDLSGDGSGLRRIQAMKHAMSYAAIDGDSQWSGNDMALGHCAMHATSEARDAKLPLQSQDGQLAVVIDGYVANYDEMVLELDARGAIRRNRSDAEIVLQAWSVMGEDCLDLIEGEFAFVIADLRSGKMHLARDHMGLRPLFYNFDGRRLVVGSHIGGVLAGMGQQPPLNFGFLAEIMTFEFVTLGETVWSGIRRVKPAHVVTFGPSGVSERQYWSVPSEPPIRYQDDREYVEHYRDVLQESVRRASRTDALLGVECSGGLDSSAVFAVADELHLSGRLPAPDIAGFTLAAPKGSAADESKYAQLVAAHLKRELTECRLYLPDASEILERAAESRNIATYPNTFMLQNMSREMVAKGCRAALNGQGGDIFLDGNGLYYHEAFAEGELGRLASYLKADWSELGPRATLAALLRGSLSHLLPQTILRLRDQRGWSEQSIEDRVSKYDWLSPELQRLLRARIADSQPQDRYVRQYKQIKVSHPLIGHLLDMIAEQNARNGLEARSPMMSRSFIEFFGRTPERIRRQGKTTRLVHRKAMSGRLPKDVLERRDKAGFEIAFRHYDEAMAECLAQAASSASEMLFSKPNIATLFERFRDAKQEQINHWTAWGICGIIWLGQRDLKDCS